MNNVDELLANGLFDLFQLGLLMLSIVIAACVAVPFLAAVVPILWVVFLRFKRWSTKSMTELKRMDQIFRYVALSLQCDALTGLIE